jgi:hypothetical protein
LFQNLKSSRRCRNHQHEQCYELFLCKHFRGYTLTSDNGPLSSPFDNDTQFQ